MRFVNDREFEQLNEMHRRLKNEIEYECTHPDSTGKFVRQAKVTYKYRTPKSRGVFSKVIDEYCTFEYANVIDV